MVEITFVKAESQVSEKTGRPYSRNVRYDEEGTNYFGQPIFPPKNLIQLACDGELPDRITYTIAAS